MTAQTIVDGQLKPVPDPDSRPGPSTPWQQDSRRSKPQLSYGTDPGSIQDQLDRWAAKHDELTEEYADVVTELADAKHDLEYERAKARERAKRRPNPRDRRYPSDLEADVARSDKVRPLAKKVGGLEARKDALWKLLRNAEYNMDRLRTHASTARTLDPRGA